MSFVCVIPWECNLYSFSGVCLQLSSMQQVVREKDARFETQVRHLHEDELLQLVTQADVETEMQQVCCKPSRMLFWLTFNYHSHFSIILAHCSSLGVGLLINCSLVVFSSVAY